MFNIKNINFQKWTKFVWKKKQLRADNWARGSSRARVPANSSRATTSTTSTLICEHCALAVAVIWQKCIWYIHKFIAHVLIFGSCVYFSEQIFRRTVALRPLCGAVVYGSRARHAHDETRPLCPLQSFYLHIYFEYTYVLSFYWILSINQVGMTENKPGNCTGARQFSKWINC